MKKQYVQFSKKCVVAVLVSVDIIVVIALFGMISSGDFSEVGEVIKAFLSFAGIVFACYSGNSLGEKIAAKMTTKTLNETVEEINGNVERDIDNETEENG